ncbi:DNA internalization-related competence protein ComEC/Rec2 [Alteribacillus bidgolensis]|uniref:Competence protein ComEC n=1 Tax=Alteribacillus bidgolensis TaxID=930129 RepID=A0A1G8NXT5_9BACI|nr:DNA internalization-related competence protein ComEC/Rec2 [Alteribacillus bidgolensis]SDI85024.1 competence protein ComEC [Alteribacillus bidgolensis]
MVKNKIMLLAGPIAAASLSLTEFSAGALVFAVFVLILYVRLLNMKVITMLGMLSIFIFLRTESVVLSNVSTLIGDEIVVNGMVTDGPYRNGNRAQLHLKVNKKENLLVRVALHQHSDIRLLRTISPGINCSAKGKLVSPIPSVNFQAFDYSQYLKTKRIHWLFETTLSDITCGKPVFNPIYLMKKWRHSGLQWINDYFPSDLRGIAGALIFGDRHMLDPNIEQAYQKLGLIHLLAVSGLHVGLISGVLYYGFLRMGVSKQMTESLLLLFLPVYIIAAGASPSVIRAASMVMLFILLKKVNQRGKAIDLLVYLVIGYIFLNPYYLLHIGFQLSFIVSGALLLSASIIKKTNTFFMSLIVTFVAQTAALPVILFHFHEFSLLSFVLNFFFVPFISFIVLPSNFLIFASSIFLPSYTTYISIPLEFTVHLAHQFLLAVSSWNGLQIIFGKPSIFILSCLSLSLFWMFYELDTLGFHKKVLWPALIVIIVLCMQCFYPYVYKNGYVTILDVGQGDSILIELPYRKGVYLIDAGGTLQFPKKDWEKSDKPYDPGESIVVPYLKSKGISTLDKMIITHSHIDHYGGAFAASEELKVRQILYGKGSDFNQEELDFLTFVQHKRIPIKFVKNGNYWKEGKAQFQVLLPEGNEETGNERSIVIRAVIGGVTWLFTGDLEKEGEQALLKKYPKLQADILKIGHHGSNTSTTEPFINQLQSKMAFISAGRCNQFGHPHKETLETLEEFGLNVFRTDTQGAVRVTLQNDRLLEIEQALSHPLEVSCE